MAEPFRTIGTTPAKVDAREKVTGSSKYGTDVIRPGMLWGRVLRSPVPHARIRALDSSRAEALPGVKAVVTGTDFPDVRYGFMIKDERPLARGKVRYAGEAVAAVAAVDEATAEEALELIRVDYEELPVLADVEEALAASTLIHEEWGQYQAIFPADRKGNIVNRSQLIRGDVERGFAEADHIFEDTFRTQVQHQAYIEPHACVAEVDPKGRITVWTCNQMPFVVRAQLGEVLQLPLSRIHVIGTRIGGAFGGKCGIMIEPIAVLLARRARRPVKIVVSYEEEFAAGFPRHACTIWMKTGVKQDGTLVARDIRLVYDTGAYANFGPLCTGNCTTLVMGPYKIPNVRVDAYCVYTNKTVASTLRSPGGPQASFAYESQMDMIAERLGLDPVELRLKNAVEDGDEWPTGQHLDKVELRRTLEEAVRASGWAEARKRRGPRGASDGRFMRGIGLAVGTWRNGTYSTGAWVRMNEDGTVLVGAGAMDLGTGTETVLAQVAAEELGLGMDRIEVMTADTDLTPYDFGAVGSRTTYVSSRAVRAAAAQVRQQLLQLAAAELEARVEDLEARDGAIRVKGSLAKAVPLAKLAGIAHKLKGGPLMGEGNFMGQAPNVDYQRLKSHPTPYLFNPSFATQVAEVEVDRETGNVRVLRLLSVNDIGFAVNPGGVAGQIEGGVAQGLGYALLEEVKYDRGRVLNGNFMTYLIPTAPDLPRVEHRLVETLADQGIDGVKGIGEPPIIPTAAAIANAIYHATGVRIRELPFTPERVATAIRQTMANRR